ncbi:Arc family DNA-binding protein [Pararhizobium sp.]|uniref:Arc family DNA-binding protein n=1 Tax=Pararhizobium sp. TaxID=1977563 RepID=UPI003D0D5723
MARPTYPSDDVDKLLLRFPEGMRDQLKEEAEKVGRSMNAEIITRLKLTLQEEIWEREKFIRLLDLKQHIIDKTLHMVIAETEKARRHKTQILYEQTLRRTLSALVISLATAILQDKSASPNLHEAALESMAKIDASEVDDLQDLDEEAIRQIIGDTDHPPPANWEEGLSEQDREAIKERRYWVKDYDGPLV